MRKTGFLAAQCDSTLESFACWGKWSGGRKVESASHLCELLGTPPSCGHRACLQSKYLPNNTDISKVPGDHQKVPPHVYCFKHCEVWIRCQKVIWACPEVTWNLTLLSPLASYCNTYKDLFFYSWQIGFNTYSMIYPDQHILVFTQYISSTRDSAGWLRESIRTVCLQPQENKEQIKQLAYFSNDAV